MSRFKTLLLNLVEIRTTVLQCYAKYRAWNLKNKSWPNYPSTLRHHTEEWQLAYYDHPLDGYSYTVEDVFVLDELHPLMFKQHVREDMCRIARVSPTQPLFRGAWSEHLKLCSVHGELVRSSKWCTAAMLLQEWGIDHEDAESFLRQTTVLLAPYPLVFLVERMRVPRVLLLARWHMTYTSADAQGRRRSRKGFGPMASIPDPTSRVWAAVGCHKPGQGDGMQQVDNRGSSSFGFNSMCNS